ncbi:MAG: PucR family transcriptional regulator, partial [Thermus sp.]
EDPALEAFCLREGLGLVLLPPWVRPEALRLEVQKRLLARNEAWSLAGLLEVLPRLMDRPFLELLYHATGLSLARLAPWGEVLAFAGTPPPEHP